MLPRLTGFARFGGWNEHWASPNVDGWSFEVAAGARFFPGAEAPHGFFVEGLFSVSAAYWLMGHSSSTNGDGETISTVRHGQNARVNFGALLGYTWIPWKHLVLSIGAGGTATRLSQYQRDSDGFRFEYTTWTLLPEGRAAIGYAF